MNGHHHLHAQLTYYMSKTPDTLIENFHNTLKRIKYTIEKVFLWNGSEKNFNELAIQHVVASKNSSLIMYFSRKLFDLKKPLEVSYFFHNLSRLKNSGRLHLVIFLFNVVAIKISFVMPTRLDKNFL